MAIASIGSEAVDIRRYWRVLRRRGGIALALMAATVVMTAALAFLSKPVYVATATVLANSPSNSTNRTLTFSDIATSNALMLTVIQRLQLPDSVDSLAPRITVTSNPSSNLYRIAVSDSDPRRQRPSPKPSPMRQPGCTWT